RLRPPRRELTHVVGRLPLHEILLVLAPHDQIAGIGHHAERSARLRGLVAGHHLFAHRQPIPSCLIYPSSHADCTRCTRAAPTRMRARPLCYNTKAGTTVTGTPSRLASAPPVCARSKGVRVHAPKPSYPPQAGDPD